MAKWADVLHVLLSDYSTDASVHKLVSVVLNELLSGMPLELGGSLVIHVMYMGIFSFLPFLCTFEVV